MCPVLMVDVILSDRQIQRVMASHHHTTTTRLIFCCTVPVCALLYTAWRCTPQNSQCHHYWNIIFIIANSPLKAEARGGVKINIGFITNKTGRGRGRRLPGILIRVSVVLSLIILDFNMTFISLWRPLVVCIVRYLLLIHPDTELHDILYDDPLVKI